MLDQEDSVIKTVVSDHSPCTPDLKLLPPNVPGTKSNFTDPNDAGDFLEAWGGVSSVGLGLPIFWTEAMRRGLAVNDTLLNVARLCSVQTALQVGLEDRKGSLQVEFDGDVAIFDDAAEFLVQKSTMLFRNTISKVLEKMEDQWESCYWSQENTAKESARLETSGTIHKGMCSQDCNISPNLLQHFGNIAPQGPTFCLREKHTRWGDTCAC
jgi:hypothetical protein